MDLREFIRSCHGAVQTVISECEMCGKEIKRGPAISIPGVKGMLIVDGIEVQFIDPNDGFVCPSCVVRGMFGNEEEVSVGVCKIVDGDIRDA